MPELEVPTEPIIDPAERAAIIDLVEDQIKKTLAQARAQEQVQPSDVTEAFLDLGLLLGSVVAPPGVGAVVGSLGAVLKPLIVQAVEASEAKAYTRDAILVRAVAAESAASEHLADAHRLAETPQREFLEKIRISIHLRRVRFLRAKAERLRAQAAELPEAG